MADTGTALFPAAKAEKPAHTGLFARKRGNSVKNAECGGNRQTGPDAFRCIAPAYLKLPSLKTVQENIRQEKDLQTPCRILEALHQVFPLDRFIKTQNDPASLLVYSLQRWLESFMPAPVLDKLNLELEICPTSEADMELFDDLLEDEYFLRFGIGSFVNSYFPLEGVIARYNELDPLLGKYLLKLLSWCPLNIGTPENIYECVSFNCWCGEKDDAEIYLERLQDCMGNDCDEEEARELARESLIVEYAELSENFPEWSFRRDQRLDKYRGIVPDELKKMEQFHKQYRRMKKWNYSFPYVCYPGILAPLNRRGFDFSCDAINQINNDHVQGGGSYVLSTLGWSFSPCSKTQMIKTFREIQTILSYFGACVEFLLNHEKEYANA